ncbi:hypothetical protein E4U42_007807, partial [Claviceps africana]
PARALPPQRRRLRAEAWDFDGPSSPGRDHLKILDDYVRFFAPVPDGFGLAWVGSGPDSDSDSDSESSRSTTTTTNTNIRSPCPLSLASDALLAPPEPSRKLFHEVTSPMSPLPSRPPRPPIRFPRLRRLRIRNVAMHAPQLSELIGSHSQTIRHFDLENVVLVDGGRWDNALAPLRDDPCWAQSRVVAAASRFSLVTSDSDEDDDAAQLPSPSPAVEAASRELLGLDLGGQESRRQTRLITTPPETMASPDETTTSCSANLRRTKTRRRRKHHPEPDPKPIITEPFLASASASHPDPSARVTALRRAKQAVLAKLSREFAGRASRPADAGDAVLDWARCESQGTLVALLFRR